jgi:phosphoglycerate kinase
MYHFKNIHDINLSYKRVLLRVALDLPLKDGKVTEDFRIREILPTLAYLLKKNCSVVLLTWLGRPDGKVVPKYRLDPVAKRLQYLIKRPIKKINDCVGLEVRQAGFDLQPGEILMLENVRFHPEEMAADSKFAAEIADGFDLEVFDAFAQSHRVHASTTGLLNYLPTVSGYLLEKELMALQGVLHNPTRPLLLIIGGAKVSDKIELTSHLINKVDKVLVGGVYANVFLKARGEPMGKSFLSDVFVNQAKGGKKDYLAIARDLLHKYPEKIILPEDLVAAPSAESKTTKVINLEKYDIDKDWAYFDIGPATIKLYLKQINRAATILWNGPMGMFEKPQFETGTAKLVQAVAESTAVSIGGGGDTETIIGKYDLAGKFSHVSTGGGAMLEFLSGKKLPALEALIKNQKNKALWNFTPRPVVEFNSHSNPYFRYPFLNLQKMLAPAQKYKFGVPALNIRSKYILDAVLEAAFEEHSPVILEVAESEMGYCNMYPERLMDLILERLPKLEKKYGYRVPITVHADHVKKDLAIADRAVKAGFSSVAVDQSEYPLPQNIRITKSVVRKVHSLGVSVEGEIGEIGQAQAAAGQIVGPEVLKYVPTVEEAVEFVAKTGIDVFAGFFGNYHGRYQRPATITWGRMRQIRRAFLRHGWPVPLALHGSSYLTTKEFNNTQIARQALKSGCYKFNHATILSDILKDNLPSQLVARMNRYAGGEKLWRKALAKYEKEIDKLDKKILDQAIAKIKEHVAVWMREAWKSSGKKKYYR